MYEPAKALRTRNCVDIGIVNIASSLAEHDMCIFDHQGDSKAMSKYVEHIT